MEAHQRRQAILALLREAGGLDVDELAARLGVSPNTVRNDFNALAAAGLLRRVRGGAAPLEPDAVVPEFASRAFLARHRLNQKSKRQIGRWAAETVEDGASILLDASTTAYYMAQSLQQVHNLTVVTNGIEAARLLAADPTNTVLLLGGLLRSDGVPVTGLFNEEVLADLHIDTAFVSAAGFTLEGGLTEADLREAQLKTKMIAAAGRVVALVDSSKFGRVYLAPFARVEQLAHLFTDANIPPEWLAELRERCARLSVCGEHGVTSFVPRGHESSHYVIGFANLGEQVPFAVEVRRSLERAAKEAGSVDLIVADNQLDGEVALAVADRLVAARPDLVIEYQIQDRLNAVLMEKFRRAEIPVIAVDIPMIGATYFGADNYRAGHMAGLALGRWIQRHWAGRFDRLLVLEEPRAGSVPAARIQGQIDGLVETLGDLPSHRITRLNCANTAEVSTAAAASALAEIPEQHRIAVIAFNDDAALGALQAARQAGREADVVIVGQGADRSLREELCRAGSRIIGSTAYHPEQYGDSLIALALKILRGEPVPPAVHIVHSFVAAAPELADANAERLECSEAAEAVAAGDLPQPAPTLSQQVEHANQP